MIKYKFKFNYSKLIVALISVSSWLIKYNKIIELKQHLIWQQYDYYINLNQKNIIIIFFKNKIKYSNI